MTGAVQIDNLTVRYAGATALDDVTLAVAENEMTALIGANGAGKSTLVKALCGLIRPDSGTITVHGRLAHVPEGREMFPDMTVDDNLRLGAWRRRRRDTAPIYDLLPDLAAIRSRRAGTLSGGQQQMVAIGRALMADPEVLVIDELSLGLAPMIVTSLVGHLRNLHATRNLSVLLIEQNARLALDLCRHAYVLESGRIVLHGPAATLARDPRVTAAYLGGHVTVTP
ncbi:ABC transporter ATP-binding protein [Actinoplanes xinjiangensis]|jgi:branched-chain amino acid transport system ATP-binding protein|uniref:Amino acid/amide ABC transporter ATP-binding protein 2 (HAAT family) n=1 Tax=Actinoplanes xinjiangensis TaxID=512350 RepID=A0A316FK91_9ACTN|nr:ABC transporter ATP-binding protein [Actinoplanes xinjiangensis]PWK48909.1 amino acid/amide ABC transporter ATP-binding protein 2 (HAAT family) [Actinoplanes xinjiangensis]GIF38616.1 ABC transporter ATP-binding protein [Actinoplanes xinjiangensis]